MSAETPSIPNHKLQKRIMRRKAIRESWPLLVWLGIAALAVWAYKTGGEFHRMRGIVSKPVQTIAAPYAGTLVPVPTDNVDIPAPTNDDGTPKALQQGTFVNQGRAVAMLDTSELQLEIKAEEQNATFERAQLQQQLGQQVLDYQAMIPQLEAEEDRIQSELEAKRKVLPSVRKNVEDRNALQSELDLLQSEIDTLVGELASAKRVTDNTRGLVDSSLENITKLQEQIDTPMEENAKVNLLKERIKRSVITTPNAGFVDKIYAQPGTFVREGDPIMDVVVQAPKTITALIPEAEALNVTQGDTVYISIPNNRKEYVTATVETLQQSLSQIPDYASPIRGRMVRGRLVEFGNLGGGEDSQLPLLPGSEVIVSLDPPGRIPFLSWFTQ